MKRQANLIEKIADVDNLRLAFWKARKAKEGKKELLEYRENLDKNLFDLRNQLLYGEPIVGRYHYFTIYDPKEREICAAHFSERVLHHAIMNICHQNFEQYQISHSYASRQGKGTYAAIDKARKYQRKYKWFLKMDVKKYFSNINHEILKVQLKRRFKDKILLKVFSKIIDTYQSSEGRGLPIGNLTSQYFANHYLALADHYAKETLQIPAYVRYMDDIILWDNCKEQLLMKARRLELFLKNELALTLKLFVLNRSEKGVSFCGYRLFPNNCFLTKNSCTRFKRKLTDYNLKLNSGEWNQKVYQAHILPLLAFVKYADTYFLRKKQLLLLNSG